jgi:hypothetical protein
MLASEVRTAAGIARAAADGQPLGEKVQSG